MIPDNPPMPQTHPAMYCLKCDYTLNYLTTIACPECGRAFDPADPTTYRSGERTRWYRASLFCGAAPLLTGIAIFLTWLVFGWYQLMAAGLFTILGGTVLVIAGAIFLTAHVKQGRREAGFRWSRVYAAAALLLVNFPVAVVIVVMAVSTYTRYVVTVQNATPVPITSFILLAPGEQIELGPIRPGGRAREVMWFKGDGQLTFEATDGGQVFHGTIEGFVTNGWGGHSHVKITNTGQVEITKRR